MNSQNPERPYALANEGISSDAEIVYERQLRKENSDLDEAMRLLEDGLVYVSGKNGDGEFSWIPLNPIKIECVEEVQEILKNKFLPLASEELQDDEEFMVFTTYQEDKYVVKVFPPYAFDMQQSFLVDIDKRINSCFIKGER